jgi:hypothetical protein
MPLEKVPHAAGYGAARQPVYVCPAIRINKQPRCFTSLGSNQHFICGTPCGVCITTVRGGTSARVTPCMGEHMLHVWTYGAIFVIMSSLSWRPDQVVKLDQVVVMWVCRSAASKCCLYVPVYTLTGLDHLVSQRKLTAPSQLTCSWNPSTRCSSRAAYSSCASAQETENST